MRVIKEHTKFRHDGRLDFNGLESYLDQVWRNRIFFEDYAVPNPSTEQQFLHLLRGNELKTDRYVGFLQFEDLSLCILPKICTSREEDQLNLFNRNLSFWLSYSRSISFPFSSISSEQDCNDDFPEALIIYFAKRTLKLLQETPFNRFELVEETLSSVRGKILFNRYLNESVSKGQSHKIICEYEPLQFDNTLNRIIKYVTRSLLRRSKFKHTWYYLENILFTLDEVEDIYVNEKDCDKVVLNLAYPEYKECLKMCRFFLEQEQISGFFSHSDHFCFLLPMQQVFEEFISGFIDVHFGSRFKSLSQHSTWLTDQEAFKMRNDIVLMEEGEIALIIDTKYKIRERHLDANKGINQSDFYQMLAYSVKSNCRKVLLLYPHLQDKEVTGKLDRFTVTSDMFEGEIEVFAGEVQIWGNDSSKLQGDVMNQLNLILRMANDC
jgi:5-methylcytosine-specific restriction enzyme subunit McrC